MKGSRRGQGFMRWTEVEWLEDVRTGGLQSSNVKMHKDRRTKGGLDQGSSKRCQQRQSQRDQLHLLLEGSLPGHDSHSERLHRRQAGPLCRRGPVLVNLLQQSNGQK